VAPARKRKYARENGHSDPRQIATSAKVVKNVVVEEGLGDEEIDTGIDLRL
jgi:hypothetical protein